MGLEKAYKSSGAIFEQASKLYSQGMYDRLKAIKPGEIVVVEGSYDHIQELMKVLKVPFDYITPTKISTHNGGRVMLVNCRTYEGGPESKAAEAVLEMVREGGRLVTTDWAVSLVGQAFPGKVKTVGKTTDDVVEVQCLTPLSRKLIGMNYAQCHPQWWLEGSSDVYSIGQGVEAIVTSKEMEKKYGQPYVMSGFQEGKGEVFHFISHLELQRTKQKPKGTEKGLDAFLEKMGVPKTDDMEDLDDSSVAELEAAFSTLSTLAYMCLPGPLLKVETKSTLFTGSGNALGSKPAFGKTIKAVTP